MSLVGAGVYGNSVCTKTLYVESCLKYIGSIATARIAYDGNFIDVYTEFSHKIFIFAVNILIFC